MTTTTSPPTVIDSAAGDLVAEWVAERPEGLLPRWKLIDRLLDLRSLVDPFDRLFVESMIVDMPGVSVVEARWWIEQLGQLQLLVAAEVSPVG